MSIRIYFKLLFVEDILLLIGIQFVCSLETHFDSQGE